VQAAKLKKSVLVVERGRRVGGVCVHTGTIPSKTLCETVVNLSGWRERGFNGRAHRNKDDITAEDLRRHLHITLDHEVEVLEHQLGASHCQPNGWSSAARGGGSPQGDRRSESAATTG